MIRAMDNRLESDRLYERVRVLFGVEPAQGVRTPDQADSPYAPPDNVGTFEVQVPPAATEPEDLTDAWLSAPNPTFGGCCPREFLDGDQEQRAFLASILSSLEDGAFS